MKPQKLLLETALLAGQIMTESNAESYRVEDTMNRILTLSDSYYAVAISFSTSLYASLDDPQYDEGSFVGIKRITSRSNNLYKISAVNKISRQLTSGQLTTLEAYQALTKVKAHNNQYSLKLRMLGVIGLSVSFAILFGGNLFDIIATAINGTILACSLALTQRYYINSGLSNVLNTMILTLVAYFLHFFVFKASNVSNIIISTLMPLVPGTAITNSLRDIFRQDYLAGGARAMEAFFEALMIALGSALALIIIRGLMG